MSNVTSDAMAKMEYSKESFWFMLKFSFLSKVSLSIDDVVDVVDGSFLSIVSLSIDTYPPGWSVLLNCK